MKNKNNVYVEVESKEQAETYRKVLEAMGEPIDKDFCHGSEDKMVFYNGRWLCGLWPNPKEEKITFGELIDLLQRKPLLVSEDGVELFEGDSYYRVGRSSSKAAGDWKLFVPDKLTSCHFVCCYKETDKAFYSESKALEWIESQKPKEKYLHLGSNTLKITANNVSGLDKLSWLSDGDIEFIYKAMEDLKNV